jgi:hypothetical protein
MSNDRTESSFPWAAAAVVFFALMALVIVLIANGGLPERNDHHCKPVAQKITCVNNLKHIGLAFRLWALDNDDRFPCNVSTNAGGAMEFCAVGRDGFERNTAGHFQVMSNELNTPKILICPQDKTKKPSADFANLQAENVTYQLRSGTNISEANPKAALAVCPIDGNTLYCDGSVTEAKK